MPSPGDRGGRRAHGHGPEVARSKGSSKHGPPHDLRGLRLLDGIAYVADTEGLSEVTWVIRDELPAYIPNALYPAVQADLDTVFSAVDDHPFDRL